MKTDRVASIVSTMAPGASILRAPVRTLWEGPVLRRARNRRGIEFSCSRLGGRKSDENRNAVTFLGRSIALPMPICVFGGLLVVARQQESVEDTALDLRAGSDCNAAHEGTWTAIGEQQNGVVRRNLGRLGAIRWDLVDGLPQFSCSIAGAGMARPHEPVPGETGTLRRPFPHCSVLVGER